MNLLAWYFVQMNAGIVNYCKLLYVIIVRISIV